MKMHTIEKVNITRLYLFVLFGVLSYVLLMIMLIYLITLIFPEFNNVSLFFVLTALVFGNYFYKFSFSKSSKNIQIKLNDKKIIIEESEVLLSNIKAIKFKGARFSYYPKIIIEIAESKKIIFRMSKNNDFDKLIEGLKTNTKTGNIFRY